MTNPFPKPPRGGFKVLLCDPPWSYKDKNSNGKRGASHKYACLEFTDLTCFYPGEVGAKDCAQLAHQRDGLKAALPNNSNLYDSQFADGVRKAAERVQAAIELNL